MKRMRYASLFAFLSIGTLLTLACPVRAATCSLSIAGNTSSFSFYGGGNTVIMQWINSVQLSSSDSDWKSIVAHWNNLSTGDLFSETDPNFDNFTAFHGGSHSFSESFNSSGVYECYCIDGGLENGFGVWSASTNHINVTITQ